MTPKQQRFVAEYLIDLNATQAAIRAGYEFAKPDGFYVYLLVDPRSGSVFYIGKGTGSRLASHARAASAGDFNRARKGKVISEIQDAGLQVTELVFCAGMSSGDALVLKKDLIAAIRLNGLTDVVGGMVTNDELCKLKARHLVARLKPFDVWLSELGTSRLQQVQKVHGDPSAFYSSFVAELKSLC